MLVFLEEKDKKYSLLSLDQKVMKCYVLVSLKKQLTFRHVTPFSTNQKHYSDLGCDTSSDSMEFLRVCLRCHVVGKPVVESLNDGCFLRLCRLCIGQPSDLYRSSKASEVWFSHLILHSHLAVPTQSSFTGGFCQPGTGIYFVPRFVVQPIFNRSFLSSKNSHFENECENEFYLHDNKNHFHNNGFARSLALKQRLGATRRWPILV